MSYPEIALSLNIAGLVIYTALEIIILRRAFLSRPETRTVVQHARLIEGPAVTLLLIVQVGLFVSAVNLARPEYVDIVRLTLAFVRSVLVLGGFWLLLAYWAVRRTWWW